MSVPLYTVLATSGRAESLFQTLMSLNKCLKPSMFGGLIVIENGEKGEIENIVSNPEFVTLKIRYLYSPMPSKSNALNIALRSLDESEALLFFTDDDVSFGEHVLVSYSKAGELHGRGRCYGGSVERAHGSAVPEDWKVPYLPLSVLGWNPQQPVGPTFFLGCNWAAFKSDIESSSGFDVRFGPGSVYGAVGQETDMQTRLLIGGCRSHYVPDAVVSHRVSSASTSIQWMLNRQFRVGVYVGISTVQCDIQYDRSFSSEGNLNVIDSTVELKGIESFKFSVLKFFMKCVWRLGVTKGVLARIRS